MDQVETFSVKVYFTSGIIHSSDVKLLKYRLLPVPDLSSWFKEPLNE